MILQIAPPNVTSEATYSVVILLMLSILGILAHILSDIAKGQQQKTFISFKSYFSTTWAAIALSFVICLVIIIVRHEFMQIPDFTKWEGIGMATIGFVGRSVLIPLFVYLNKFGIKADEDTVKTILLFVFIGLATSCSTPKKQIAKARETFNTYPDSFASNCANAFPPKEKIKEKLIVKPGKTVYVPGATKYVTVDCDSAVRASGQKTIKIKIPNSAKGYSERVDTFIKEKVVTIENTAAIKALQQIVLSQTTQIATQNQINKTVTAGYKQWKRYAIGEGLVALAIVGAWVIKKRIT